MSKPGPRPESDRAQVVLVFNKNGKHKNSVSILDGGPEAVVETPLPTQEKEASQSAPLQAGSRDKATPDASPISEFTEVAQQTTSFIHQLQKDFESRRSGKPNSSAVSAAPGEPVIPRLTRPPATNPAAPSLLSPTGAQPVREPSPDELEQELQQYFGESNSVAAPKAEPVKPVSNSISVLDAIRERVIAGVVDRILNEWQQPGNAGASPLQREVTERLIQRVIQGIGTSGSKKP